MKSARSVHVTMDGQPVVDLWGGAADAAVSQPWTADTLVNVWSTTKGWLALAMHMLADRGLLDFDAPVAKYWPEFAQHGKESVLVRHILTHTSGLPAPSLKVPDEAVYEWNTMVRALEQSELFWEPGTQCGYHAATFGWLNGEVLRRITGMSVGKFLRTQIAKPLGADTFVGLSRQEQERTAETIPPSPLGNFIFKAMLALGGRARSLAFTNPPRPAEDSEHASLARSGNSFFERTCQCARAGSHLYAAGFRWKSQWGAVIIRKSCRKCQPGTDPCQRPGCRNTGETHAWFHASAA